MKRPAETAGATTGLAGALVALGVGDERAAAIALAVGVVPGIVTWLVDHGGLRGAARRLWRGNT